MTSQAERKRRKKARITLPGGEAIPQRPTGKDRRHTNQPAEDARATVAAARQRHTGIKDAKDAIQPICGTDLGLCIRHMTTGDDRAALENTWAAISATHRNYRLLYIGNTGNPQGAAIAMVPEPMQADQSLRVDIRSPEERVNAAKSAWAAWEAKIAALPTPLHKWALRAALNGFMGEAVLWKDQAPTDKGRVAVQALRMVAA